MEKLRVFEAFAGVGSQHMALRNIGIDYEIVGISEIDKSAIESYMAIHGDTHNYGDISKLTVDDLPDMDLFTYSFPCTDLSIAGKQKGFKEGSGTSSSLLWECRKVITGKLPKFLMLENVKPLLSNKYYNEFQNWLGYLESLGYTSYYDVLNAKDFGAPQSRERVFVISILGDHEFFTFPQTWGTPKVFKDILEEPNDKLTYMKEEHFNRLTRLYPSRSNDIKQVYKYERPNRENSTNYRVFSLDSLVPTLTTSGGSKGPAVLLKDVEDSHCNEDIRYMTPLEYWRAMGFSDEDFYKAKEVSSNTELYKQAGNSIAVPVLEALFSYLLYEYKKE